MVVQDHLTSPVNEEKLDETIVCRAIGPVGRWQLEKACLLGFCSVPLAWHFMQYPLITQEKGFWCKVPTDPGGVVELLKVDRGQCWSSQDESDDPVRCQEWEFEPEDGRVSLQQDFQLVCQHENLLSLRQIIFFLGMTLGCLTTGN